MLIGKINDDNKISINLRASPIQQISEFRYLGSLITNKNQSKIDIKRIIALAKQGFHKNYRNT